MAAIYYFCPEIPFASMGVRILFRHVEVLARNGFNASILHAHHVVQIRDVPKVPVNYLSTPFLFTEGDVVVIPEGFGDVIEELKKSPVRRMVIALNWDYIYDAGTVHFDWRTLGVERVLTYSPFIGDLIAWSMRLPVSYFRWGVNPTLYYPPDHKDAELVFIHRKQDRIQALRKILSDRDARLATQFRWTPLQGMLESEYAAVIRRASIFLNLSRGEGLPCPMLEAMRCNTLIAGYNSIGAQRELIGSGPNQNAILAETMDYATLAMKLEPILLDLLKGDRTRIQPILQNALTTSKEYDWDAEESSIIAMWRALSAGAA